MFKPILLTLALSGFVLSTNAQEKKPEASTKKIAVPVKKADSVPGAPKAYNEVITAKAKTSVGMINVHQIALKYFFEIPDTLLGRELLIVNRISKAASGTRPQMLGYAGDEIAENVVSFEKGPNDRIFLRLNSFNERSGDTTSNGLYKSVRNSNIQPIVASFSVKAYGQKGQIKSSVIDVTEYLNTENEVFFFSPGVKTALGIGGIQTDKSYIGSLSTYPKNVEIRTIRTYTKGPVAGQPTISTIPVTYELNSSMVLLPKIPMKARYADARVGFFAHGYTDFDGDPQGVRQSAVMVRWRMEPKTGDIEKYKRGKLVEPKKPIIYYIDPATPKKWVPYLIAGVNDWAKAFEQAGFKNAIKALPAPANDPNWSIDDATHNVIVYKPSSVANASGPNVHDPRSGEIIESHINWYHNIMQLVRNWYMIQAGAIDHKARKLKFDDELMGQLIRFVSSHEVGHTLGLLHNYGSSSTVPVEKLRDKAFVEKYGHTPSIMDYARFNYVAQPEDHITQKGIFPRIGEYDRWAIEFGYRWLPQFNSPDAEIPYMNKLIIDSLDKNKRLFFGSEGESLDPRSQSEDLGDDAVKASIYGIKNLQRIIPQLKDWTKEPNEGYENLKLMYDQAFRQYMLYTAHVLKTIGGEYHTNRSIEQNGNVFEPVSYKKQKEAMQFFNDYVFNIPEWMLKDQNDPLTRSNPGIYMEVAQNNALQRLQGSGILMEFIKNEEYSKGKTYTCSEFLEDLKKSIWTELYTGKSIDLNRRNLQKTYITNTINSFKATGEIVGKNSGNGVIYYINPDPTRNDVSSLVRAHLISLKEDIRKAIPSQKGMSLYHLEDAVKRIDDVLDPVK
ncbi:zinc-dependent metalloprotease [Pedobacter sp. MC2016-14]|uniref:zinc-dependent metalloprotease n=1 Tax=Pedobacter sp. MC2016-14 TaxID=2897327 RepID=UPI001E3C9072|nr:zinc-dependent metalloprotease [Pedobacter sp. MC2016-14]MCD0488719.1 zinc-dependent metalloprotease [Pedobacter sp. MC2016-14]